MPYSDYAVANRKAVAQLKYQIRRFLRQMQEGGTPPDVQEQITQAFNQAFALAAGSIDYDDDGTRIPPQTGETPCKTN